jgi:hypothetical protein
LTQLGVDIKELKRLLNKRREHDTAARWAAAIDPELAQLIGRPLPSRADLREYVTDGRPGGAMQKALYLRMLAVADKDLLDDRISLSFPHQETSVQLHHIYPRDWCRNNRIGTLAYLLDDREAGRDWVNAVCNLMPLSRQSNNVWKAKIPGQVLSEREIGYEHSSALLKNAFIDEGCFAALLRGPDGLSDFWERRAELIVEDLLARMSLVI